MATSKNTYNSSHAKEIAWPIFISREIIVCMCLCVQQPWIRSDSWWTFGARETYIHIIVDLTFIWLALLWQYFSRHRKFSFQEVYWIFGIDHNIKTQGSYTEAMPKHIIMNLTWSSIILCTQHENTVLQKHKLTHRTLQCYVKQKTFSPKCKSKTEGMKMKRAILQVFNFNQKCNSTELQTIWLIHCDFVLPFTLHLGQKCDYVFHLKVTINI